jgi:hypothetical protein
MTDDRTKAMLWEGPEHIPVTVSILPAAWMKHRERMDEIVQRHPVLFGPFVRNRNYDAVHSDTYIYGDHVDEWGCIWRNMHSGREAIVLPPHPVPTREAVRSLRPPKTDAGFKHGFMYLRLCDLRGFEEVMVDFAEEPPELQMLIDVVLAHNLRQARLALAKDSTPGRIVGFGDDLGMQRSLPMSPQKWRKYLKPCFAAIYKLFRDAGQYVYMHTDGHIIEIIPDLIDCGVNVVNPQVRANGLAELAKVCKGKVCVCLDLDRQMFPFCTPADIDAHVREAVQALGDPSGGLWLLAEVGDDVPLENVEAICQALEKYRGYFSGRKVSAPA